jgi:hypothetical protein
MKLLVFFLLLDLISQEFLLGDSLRLSRVNDLPFKCGEPLHFHIPRLKVFHSKRELLIGNFPLPLAGLLLLYRCYWFVYDCSAT